MRRINQILLVLLCAFSLMGASLPTTKPEDVGLSSERLQRIHAMVLHHMDLGEITGALALAARKGQVAIVGNHRVSDGSFGWSGAYGTHFWVDPKEELVAVMMIQTPIREMRPEFENAVMQAIIK
jgi:CubicO group peptidase (beta-lactamase class C family)